MTVGAKLKINQIVKLLNEIIQEKKRTILGNPSK
jgi:hypothetical protein